MKIRVVWSFLLGLPLGLVIGGCGSSSPGAAPLPTLPVKGKVTYNGKPLTRGTIKFAPDDGFGREAQGPIQPDGTFLLSTFKDGDGAVPGVHRVAVSGTGKSGREVVPTRLCNTTSSRFEVEVKQDQAEYDVNLR